jgi:hypothetical protein
MRVRSAWKDGVLIHIYEFCSPFIQESNSKGGAGSLIIVNVK